MRAPQAYADATRGGVALGLVLLASFAVAGRGIGASGAFAAAAGSMVGSVSPVTLAADPALADRLPSGVNLLNDWIVMQIAGVILGAALSARWSGRRQAIRAAGTVSRSRLTRALAGGALMGLGARLAYGCTSGLALTGGALLATGAWIFIPVAFGTAALVALLSRKVALQGAR
ncbi:MAG TPA: YeeE/YedE thiosulfate transporter family protein [Gemmatimonadaceae bacterium]|nr:YeeE/YedE thiosulfate transporter family protein [Gemmatimonadaceae bacterium]